MVFSAVASHSTKNIITTTNYPLNEPFLVEAVHYPAGKTPAEGEVLMSSVTVSYDLTDGLWKTEEDYFWPMNGMARFYAASPVTPQVSFSAQGGMEADWEIKTDEQAQIDLCFAETIEDCMGHSAQVPVVFSHALSQICFKARTQKSYSSAQIQDNIVQANVINIYLDSVKVEGIHCAGHFTQNPLEWTYSTTEKANYTVFRSTEGLPLNCDRYDTPILEPLVTLLLIPQMLPADARVQEWHHAVVRTSQTDTSTGTIVSDETYTISKTSILPLSQYCRAWRMDHKYTFRISVGLDDTEIIVAKTDWTETKEIILGDE